MKKKTYNATARILGKVYSSTGSTISEAIENLKPGQVRGVCVLTIKGKEAKERIIAPIQTYKLFNSAGLTRQVSLKNVSSLFEGLC
jgi:hypothetical protein